ncbi:chemotaxis protein CheW [Marinomonas dokdonensis]|uniref:chemotaxis protein CheW n=1 Tax=Marinomonas dokdonensis TaxID=328224 RepID=UPI0040556106
MKDTKHQDDVLIGPQAALQQYLDDLLQDATNQAIESDSEQQAEQEALNTAETKSEIAFDSQVKSPDEIISEAAEPIATTEPTSTETDTTNLGVELEVEVEEPVNEEPEVEKSEVEESDAEMAVATDTEELAEAAREVEESLPVEALAEPSSQVEDAINDQQSLETCQEPLVQPKLAKTEPLPWAKSRFECLLFYVGGLKMAVPLVELGGIHQGNHEKLASIFGQPDWFMGVLKLQDQNIRTVDTARWVMPDHYQGELKDHFQFVIQLDRTDWGIACEKVAEAISLEPGQVKWRTDRSKRPWLAGTVIEHMCAILDIQGFIELLEDPSNGFKALSKK